MNTRPKFNVPNRNHPNESKRMLSVRLPESLVSELKAIAKERGWTTTDVIHTALDQFVSFTREQENTQREAA